MSVCVCVCVLLLKLKQRKNKPKMVNAPEGLNQVMLMKVYCIFFLKCSSC